MRRTLPKRKGEPCIKSGKPLTANLDVGSTQRLAWASHVAKRLLKTEAYGSVLLRRAVRVYIEHLEDLLNAGQEERAREVELIASAARGETSELPEDALLEVPIKPYSTIRRDANEAAQQEGLAKIRANMLAAMEAWERRAMGGRGG